MAFTSFRDTLERMRNDLASGNWRVKSYDIDGMQREFFSPAEFMQMLDYVERKAADEAAVRASAERFLAGPGAFGRKRSRAPVTMRRLSEEAFARLAIVLPLRMESALNASMSAME